MQDILYCSLNIGRHYIRVISALTIARAKIITNIICNIACNSYLLNFFFIQMTTVLHVVTSSMNSSCCSNMIPKTNYHLSTNFYSNCHSYLTQLQVVCSSCFVAILVWLYIKFAKSLCKLVATYPFRDF